MRDGWESASHDGTKGAGLHGVGGGFGRNRDVLHLFVLDVQEGIFVLPREMLGQRLRPILRRAFALLPDVVAVVSLHPLLPPRRLVVDDLLGRLHVVLLVELRAVLKIMFPARTIKQLALHEVLLEPRLNRATVPIFLWGKEKTNKPVRRNCEIRKF